MNVRSALGLLVMVGSLNAGCGDGAIGVTACADACEDGQVCSADGACIAVGSCVDARDCLAGESCTQSLCTTESAGVCAADGDCAASEFCSLAGRCIAAGACLQADDCGTLGDACSPRHVCLPAGTCELDADCGLGMICSEAACIEGDGCPGVDVDLTAEIPTVTLLIDQSGSMDQDFGGVDRWTAVERALVAPDTGVVTNLKSSVRFGATLYTSHNGFEGGECAILTEVPAALENYDAIRDLMADNGPDDDTPTGDAIDGLVQNLQAAAVEQPAVIVLATDGEPDTCEVPDPQGGQAEAIAAAQRAFAAGYRVYVLGVGSEVGAAHLQDMANAGAGLPVGGGQNATYFSANDPDALAAAFQTIVGGTRSCSFDLSGMVDPEAANLGQVEFNGASLAYDDPNGWRLVDEDTLELLGSACAAALQQPNVNLRAVFPCGTVIF